VCFLKKNSNSDIKLTPLKKRAQTETAKLLMILHKQTYKIQILLPSAFSSGPLQIFNSLIVALKQVSADGRFCPSPLQEDSGSKGEAKRRKGLKRQPVRDNCKLQARSRSQKSQRMRPPTTRVKTTQGTC